MNNYRGLLCDLDGTLADSEPVHRSAWLEVLNEQYGLSYDDNWFEQYIGTSDRVLAADVIKNNELSVEVDDLINQKQDTFHAAIRRNGKGFDGIDEVLEKISASYPLAIATNSGRADAEVVVPKLGLDRFTEVVVTAKDVDNLKPAPDIYLLAAERLGLPADQCIAIEDSRPGGKAAKAAGSYLIGLDPKLDMADEIVMDNAAALRRALELLGGAE